MPSEFFYLIGTFVGVWFWFGKKRRFRKDRMLNVVDGRTRVIRRGGGF